MPFSLFSLNEWVHLMIFKKNLSKTLGNQNQCCITPKSTNLKRMLILAPLNPNKHYMEYIPNLSCYIIRSDLQYQLICFQYIQIRQN